MRPIVHVTVHVTDASKFASRLPVIPSVDPAVVSETLDTQVYQIQLGKMGLCKLTNTHISWLWFSQFFSLRKTTLHIPVHEIMMILKFMQTDYFETPTQPRSLGR
jgi:hypothetical protein